MLVGVSPSWPDDKPVPVRDVGPGVAPPLMDIATLPVAVPAVPGVKVTAKVALWPTASLKGTLEGEL